jgi:hypothetical protein
MEDAMLAASPKNAPLTAATAAIILKAATRAHVLRHMLMPTTIATPRVSPKSAIGMAETAAIFLNRVI